MIHYVRSCTGRPATARALFIPAVAAAAVLLAAALPTGSALAGATSTMLTSSQTTSVFGEPVDFTATVVGNEPTGNVTFKDGATTLGSGAPSPSRTGPTVTNGFYHTCVITSAGAAQCWGGNPFGVLGDGTTDNSPTPVNVHGLSSGVTSIEASREFTCALTDAGKVWCWGNNSSGQLGDGTNAGRTEPVQVTGLPSDIAAIAVGGHHVCALTGAGAVWCWGNNVYGQLGNGTTTSSTTPVAVNGLGSGVAAIGTGTFHSCAILDSGALKCWGWNNVGQLGDGTTTDRHTPAAVSGMSSGIASVSVGGYFTCAMTDAGAIKCWGYNQHGELGDGTTTDSNAPVAVTGLPSGIAGLYVNYFTTCALTQAGAPLCWGYNYAGQLGDGTTTDRSTPVAVSGLSSGVVAVTTGFGDQTCALLSAGSVKCWGLNDHSQVGDGTTINRSTPILANGFTDNTVLLPNEGGFTLTTSDLSVGTHAITARFEGDSNNAASTSSVLSHVVNKGETDTTLKVKPKAPKGGKSARLKIQVAAVAPASGKPAGKAVVKDGRKKLGKVKVKNGKAGLRTGNLTAGKHKFKVTYKGDGNWEKSRASKKVKVR